MSFYKPLIIVIAFFSINVDANSNESIKSILSIDGYIQTSKSITDNNWGFIPDIVSSFDYSETSINEVLFIKNNLGLKYKQSNFTLDLVRPIHPKSINLTADSKLIETILILNNSSSISISYKEQIADTQSINCYTFSSLTIGFCDEAQIKITNSKDKYKQLNGNMLMLLDGKNEELKFSYTKAVGLLFLDEYFIYFAVSENKFDWLSPIEELTTGFISNLGYGGSTIGELVTNEIKRLPQRDAWLFYKLGFNLSKRIPIFNHFDIFYEADVVFVESDDYITYQNINNHNIKINSGVNIHNNNFELLIFGTLYKNNLFGYEDISFNQRSEHHFSSNYGSLNMSIKYKF